MTLLFEIIDFICGKGNAQLVFDKWEVFLRFAITIGVIVGMIVIAIHRVLMKKLKKQIEDMSKTVEKTQNKYENLKAKFESHEAQDDVAVVLSGARTKTGR
ncbi:MAG: hypothetical protein NC293_00300 [Roseburia sp.]|nr:hypothetical protein [Roseburia sp.]